jgi:hypothetical protein
VPLSQAFQKLNCPGPLLGLARVAPHFVELRADLMGSDAAHLRGRWGNRNGDYQETRGLNEGLRCVSCRNLQVLGSHPCACKSFWISFSSNSGIEGLSGFLVAHVTAVSTKGFTPSRCAVSVPYAPSLYAPKCALLILCKSASVRGLGEGKLLIRLHETWKCRFPGPLTLNQ